MIFHKLFSEVGNCVYAKYPEIMGRWISVSNIADSFLDRSLMVVSVQKVGMIDGVLRLLEDEAAEQPIQELNETQIQSILLAPMFKSILSDSWIELGYEIVRTIRERVKPDDLTFEKLFNELELIRIPSQKHELRRNNNLKKNFEKIDFSIYGAPQDEKGRTEYKPNDSRRGYIMAQGYSPRGSLMWNVCDITNHNIDGYWLERRQLADDFLDVFENVLRPLARAESRAD